MNRLLSEFIFPHIPVKDSNILHESFTIYTHHAGTLIQYPNMIVEITYKNHQYYMACFDQDYQTITNCPFNQEEQEFLFRYFQQTTKDFFELSKEEQQSFIQQRDFLYQCIVHSPQVSFEDAQHFISISHELVKTIQSTQNIFIVSSYTALYFNYYPECLHIMDIYKKTYDSDCIHTSLLSLDPWSLPYKNQMNDAGEYFDVITHGIIDVSSLVKYQKYGKYLYFDIYFESDTNHVVYFQVYNGTENLTTLLNKSEKYAIIEYAYDILSTLDMNMIHKLQDIDFVSLLESNLEELEEIYQMLNVWLTSHIMEYAIYDILIYYRHYILANMEKNLYQIKHYINDIDNKMFLAYLEDVNTFLTQIMSLYSCFTLPDALYYVEQCNQLIEESKPYQAILQDYPFMSYLTNIQIALKNHIR